MRPHAAPSRGPGMGMYLLPHLQSYALQLLWRGNQLFMHLLAQLPLPPAPLKEATQEAGSYGSKARQARHEHQLRQWVHVKMILW